MIIRDRVYRVPAAATAMYVAASMLVGCASWLNPHVSPSMKPENLAPSEGDSSKDAQFAGNLAKAIDYANAWRTTYYDAVGEQSKLKNAVSLTLIPMSALALFFGITSDSRAGKNAITALAIGGASLFVAGNLLHNVDYQQVYLAGSQAMGCAILAARPLLVEKHRFEEFENALKAINEGIDDKVDPGTKIGSIADVENKMDKVQWNVDRVRNASPNEPLLNEAEDQLKLAAKVVSKAKTAVTKGRAFKGRVTRSSITLTQVVHNIRDAVSVEIAKREPTLQSVASQVAGLGNFATGFGQISQAQALKPKFLPPPPPPSVPRPTAAPPPEVVMLNTAMEDLHKATETLAGNVNIVAAVNNEADEASQAVTAIEQCEVAEIPGTFRVSPQVAEIELKLGESYEFSVSGGTGIPAANALGKAAASLNIDGPKVAGNAFAFTVRAKTKEDGGNPGEAMVEFADTTNVNRATVKVKIVEGEVNLEEIAKKIKEQKSFTRNGGTFTITGATVDKDRNLVSVTLQVDKKPTQTTSKKDLRDTIANIPGVKGKKFTVEIKNYAAIEDDLTVDPAGAVFRAVADVNDRIKIQKALCLRKQNPVDGKNDRDGEWGPRTKHAVTLYQEMSEASATDGVLTVAQKGALLVATDPDIADRCKDTLAAVYNFFVDELDKVKGPNKVIGFNGMTFTVKKIETDSANERIDVTVSLSSSTPAGKETEIQAAVSKFILAKAIWDDYWIGEKQLNITLKPPS